MLGTVVNCTTIVIGSAAGAWLKSGIAERYRQILVQAMGLAAAALGINAVTVSLPHSQYPVLFIISLALGGLAGEWLDAENRFNRAVGRFSKGNLAEGLSTAVLLFCVGTLSILGPIESALKGNNTYLFANAVLDGVTSAVLASVFGFGIALAALILLVWQGSLYYFAGFLSGFISPDLLTEISVIGGVLLISTGINILKIKQIKTMNLLPALLVPPLFFAVKRVLGF